MSEANDTMRRAVARHADADEADSVAFQDAVAQPYRPAAKPVPLYPESNDEPIMQFFSYAHLPEHLQPISQMFHQLAKRICETLPRCAERSVSLRKLLEGKDAAVRAALAK